MSQLRLGPATDTIDPGNARDVPRARRGASSGQPPWMEPTSTPAKIGKAIVLAIIAGLMILPIVYVVGISFSSYHDVARGDLVLIPANPTLDAYRAVLGGTIVVRALIVSFGITLLGTLINMAMTVSMAYGLAKPNVPGSRFVLVLVLFTLLFGAGIIPNYLLINQLNMIDSYWSLILPGAISAFNLVIIRNFFMSVPQELLDSARIDGASDWQLLWDITLPLSKAVLAVIALFYGVAHWNAFFDAILYLNDQQKWPIQVVLRQYVLQGSAFSGGADYDPSSIPPPARTVQMAVLVIATLPILMVYPFLQKYFTKGVLSGAIKG